MRKQYDFSRSEKNPYAKRLKRQVTIRLDGDTLEYFKGLAAEAALPYQTLINMYLRDCAQQGKRLRLDWKPTMDRVGAGR
jgi:predicted DNA binding CopG/RHH family protein